MGSSHTCESSVLSEYIATACATFMSYIVCGAYTRTLCKRRLNSHASAGPFRRQPQHRAARAPSNLITRYHNNMMPYKFYDGFCILTKFMIKTKS